MYIRLSKYFEKHLYLSDKQFGFKAHHFTSNMILFADDTNLFSQVVT